MAKIEEILSQYGSIEAYKEYIEERKRQYAEDREMMLQREKERKA